MLNYLARMIYENCDIFVQLNISIIDMLIGFEINKIAKIIDTNIIYTDKFILALKDEQMSKYKICKSVIIYRNVIKDIVKAKETYMLLVPSIHRAWLLKLKHGRPRKEFVKVIDEYNHEEIEIKPIIYEKKDHYLIIHP